MALMGANGQGGGGAIWRSATHYPAPNALKNGNFWKFLGKNWVKWHIFGAAGDENFDKFWYLNEKSPIFVKVEDFLIIMHKMTKKVEKTHFI